MNGRPRVRIVDPLPVDWQPYPAGRGFGKTSAALQRIGEQISRGGMMSLAVGLSILGNATTRALIEAEERAIAEHATHRDTPADDCRLCNTSPPAGHRPADDSATESDK